MTTALDRIIERSNRTQPFTPVERAFFGVSDTMAKPNTTIRRPMQIDSYVLKRLNTVLTHDDRFNGTYGNGIGFSEFITRALDALECEG